MDFVFDLLTGVLFAGLVAAAFAAAFYLVAIFFENPEKFE